MYRGSKVSLLTFSVRWYAHASDEVHGFLAASHLRSECTLGQRRGTKSQQGSNNDKNSEGDVLVKSNPTIGEPPWMLSLRETSVLTIPILLIGPLFFHQEQKSHEHQDVENSAKSSGPARFTHQRGPIEKSMLTSA